jgi:hypothetical protein
MQPEHDFSTQFKSEDDLRKTLAKLLAKMGKKGVQITHGAQEYGKDLVFYEPDSFGSDSLIACVVKNGKITGSADSVDSARNVLIQVEQALDTPYINPAGVDEHVSRVFVVCPYPCSQITLRAIQGKLKTRSGQVSFLCGAALLELFNTHWPDFIAFEAGALNAYVASLQRSFDRADPMSYLAGQHQIFANAAKTLRSVYVRQTFCIELQQLEFLLDPLDLKLLGRPIDLADLNDFNAQVDFVTNVIQHTQGAPGQTALELAELCRSLKVGTSWLVEAWDEAWRLQSQSNAESGTASVPRSQAKVSLSEHLPQFVAGLHKAQNIVLEIESAIKGANQLVFRYQSKPILFLDLQGADYKTYARIRELAHLAPSVFRKTSDVVSHSYPEDLLQQTSDHLFITAPAGYGKTSFCKWNALNDVDNLISGVSTVIPVYVPLHQLANATLRSCEQAFFDSAEVQGLVSGARAKGRTIRLYLDGLDEVSSPAQREKLISFALEVTTKYKGTQVVATGRTYVMGDGFQWLTRLLLSELSNSQLEKLIHNWLSAQPEILDAFNLQLDKTPSLKPLMRTPLLGTLVIAVFKRMNSLPDSKVRLYETFVDLMCGGWDVAKNVRRDTKYGSQAKLRILTRLAGILHLNERREAFEADQRSAVSQVMGSFVNETVLLFNEMLEDGLIQKVGVASVAFSHLSFQEYLCATELMDPQGQRSLQALKSYLRGDDWWREPVSFLIGMLQRPSETEAWLRRTSEDLKDRAADIERRYDFLRSALRDAWPGWVSKAANPSFYGTTPGTPRSAAKRS